MRFLPLVLFLVSNYCFSQSEEILSDEDPPTFSSQSFGRKTPFNRRIVQKNDKYGYVNDNFENIIPTIYDHAGAFRDNGLAVVSKNKLYGTIDTFGNEVIPIKYKNVSSLRNSNFIAYHKNQFTLFDKNGKSITHFLHIKDYTQDGINNVIKLSGKKEIFYINYNGKRVKLKNYKPIIHDVDLGLYYKSNKELPTGGKVAAIYKTEIRRVRKGEIESDSGHLAIIIKNKKYYFATIKKKSKRVLNFSIKQPKSASHISNSFTTSKDSYTNDNMLAVEITSTDSTITMSLNHDAVQKYKFFYPNTVFNGTLIGPNGPVDLLPSRKGHNNSYFKKYDSRLVGVQDRTGKELIPPIYKSILHLEKDWFFVQNNQDNYFFLNAQRDSLPLNTKRTPFLKNHAGSYLDGDILTTNNNSSAVLITDHNSIFMRPRLNLRIKGYHPTDSSIIISYDSKTDSTFLLHFPTGNVVNKMSGDLEIITPQKINRYKLSKGVGKAALVDENYTPLTDFIYADVDFKSFRGFDYILLRLPEKMETRACDLNGKFITEYWTTSNPYVNFQGHLIDKSEQGINIYNVRGVHIGPHNIKSFKAIQKYSGKVNVSGRKNIHIQDYFYYVETEERSGLINSELKFINNSNYIAKEAGIHNGNLIAFIQSGKGIKIFFPKTEEYLETEYDDVMSLHRLPRISSKDKRPFIKWIEDNGFLAYNYLLLKNGFLHFVKFSRTGDIDITATNLTPMDMPTGIKTVVNW
jgi:hypothetical protein